VRRLTGARHAPERVAADGLADRGTGARERDELLLGGLQVGVLEI
jgi:hypothetical protein